MKLFFVVFVGAPRPLVFYTAMPVHTGVGSQPGRSVGRGAVRRGLAASYDANRQEHLLIGTSKGRPWVDYWFNFDKFFYRLDWYAQRWSVSLRFYKKGKSADDLARMRRVAQRMRDLLENVQIVTVPFRKSNSSVSSGCLLIDPFQSDGIFRLHEAHADLVRQQSQV